MRILGILFLLVVLIGGAAWWFRDSLPFLDRGENVEVSLEAAEAADDKLTRLRSEGVPARLSSTELSSLLRYRAPEWVPEALRDPAAQLNGDTLGFAGTVSTDWLPAHPDIDRVRNLLPDSARVKVAGTVRITGQGRSALAVRQVEFAGVPIPERYYPPMLERIGRTDADGLAANEMLLPLPPGVSEMRVEDGYLILIP